MLVKKLKGSYLGPKNAFFQKVGFTLQDLISKSQIWAPFVLLQTGFLADFVHEGENKTKNGTVSSGVNLQLNIQSKI